jgi:hypothetical protein
MKVRLELEWVLDLPDGVPVEDALEAHFRTIRHAAFHTLWPTWKVLQVRKVQPWETSWTPNASENRY